MNAERVVFLVNALGYGGAEVQVSRLALGMKRRGRDVTVVSLIPPVGLADELRDHRVDVRSLNMRPGMPNPWALVRLLKILKNRRPQVVHSHIVHANLLARLVRPLAKVQVLVCTAHSIVEGKRWLDLAYRCTDRMCDLTTNVSRTGVDRYVRIGAAPEGRIRFVPNGLDLQDFQPDAPARARLRRELGLEARFVWLAAGRLSRAKDYPNMLRAFATVGADDSRAVLLLAGRGELEHEIRALARSLELGERVRFLGLRTDIAALMNCADAYVMSSAWEGMPLVLQEASATELPIVATAVGGTGEVVMGDRSGILVSPGDAAALARAMRRVTCMSEAERAAMGRAGRAHVQSQFGIEHVLDTWDGIYRALLREKVARRLPGVAHREFAPVATAQSAE